MTKRTAKFIAHSVTQDNAIETEWVSLVIDDGTRVELRFHHSNGEISLSTNGTMLIFPRAANTVRIARGD